MHAYRAYGIWILLTVYYLLLCNTSYSYTREYSNFPNAFRFVPRYLLRILCFRNKILEHLVQMIRIQLDQLHVINLLWYSLRPQHWRRKKNIWSEMQKKSGENPWNNYNGNILIIVWLCLVFGWSATLYRRRTTKTIYDKNSTNS